jgi:hypothetical protein
MKRIVPVLILLAGCTATEAPTRYSPEVKAIAQMTPAERCDEGMRLINSPQLDVVQKQVAFDTMKKIGCL